MTEACLQELSYELIKASTYVKSDLTNFNYFSYDQFASQWEVEIQ